MAQHDDYFLVSFDEKKENKEELKQFLEQEKFYCRGGSYGCPWFFIDIHYKIYYPGRPGVSYGKVVGNHAITFDEFKTIYYIYKKYQGLDLFEMDRKNKGITWDVIEKASMFKTKEPSKINAEDKKETVSMITVNLSNGMMVRIPSKGWEETLGRLESNIQKNNVVKATYRLSDGTLVTIPKDEHVQETLQRMEEIIKKNKK